jgi:hypothetical protein
LAFKRAKQFLNLLAPNSVSKSFIISKFYEVLATTVKLDNAGVVQVINRSAQYIFFITAFSERLDSAQVNLHFPGSPKTI